MLREFKEWMVDSGDANVIELWTLYDEVQGVEQLMFKGSGAALTYRVKAGLSFVVASKEQKVLDHARYLIQRLWFWWRENEEYDMAITLYGQAYQTIIPLVPHFKVDHVYSNGTVERVDRFNNSHEQIVKNLVGVVFKWEGE
jgi:hypothetical protein